MPSRTQVSYTAADATQAIFGLGIDETDALDIDPTAEIAAAVAVHTDDTADAHDASAVSILDTAAYISGTDVEAALVEIRAREEATLSNEVQTITLSSWDSGDTIRFTFNAHETTAVTYASDVSATIQAALIALADFDTGDLTVSRTDINTYVVTFAGARAGKEVTAITCTNGTGSATGTVTETTKGGQVVAASLANATQASNGGLEKFTAMGATGTTETIDLANGNVQSFTVDGNLTVTMPSGLTTGKAISFTLILTDSGGPRNLAFTGVKWSGGTDPTAMSAASAIDIYTFLTVDGGTTWYGFTGGTGMAT